ncbi:hypothetical protein BKA83DRAFT_19251 [Pisolithus microcarpus]|nr:hypothetical protein BKA83DRAFT_19251 [Pisolithus microcarpus]
MSQRPRRSNANLHPGRIVLDSQIQRRTSEQKHANDEALQQTKDAELADAQKAYGRVGAMESAMAARQAQDGTRSEKAVRPKPRPQSADQSKGDVEAETKLGTAKEINNEHSDIGPKAREKTILKLRSAIEQARKQVGAETESGTAKSIEHEQPVTGRRPLRREKTMLSLRGATEESCKMHSTATPSAHSQAMGKNAINTHDEKSGIEGRVKNWNEIVLSATAAKTPLSETPKRQWGLSDLDPPTPSEGQDYEEREARSQSTSPIAGDQTAVIVDNKYSDVETAYMFDTQCVDTPTPAAINLKRKRDDSAGDDSEHTSEVGTAIDEENEEGVGIARAHRATSKTFVRAIDVDEPHGPPKEIGLKHYSICHRVQKSRSSITPSVASDSVPTSDFPESETTRTSSSGSRFTNSDLPPLFLKGRNWAKIFLPTLLLWVGDQPNIWSIPEDNIVHALREIIKVVYPTFVALDDVCPNTPIFSVASQRLSGWRHSLGSIAIALLDCYFASDPNTDVEQTCEALLRKRAFAYEDLDSSNLDKAFHGAFILQLLANAHLRSCAGSVDVPALHLSPKQYRARGAIALCVTALERAIKLTKSKSVSVEATDKSQGSVNLLKGNRKHKSGRRPANAEHTFSEQNWGSATSSYFQSVANRESHVLQGIVRMAYAILQDDSDRNSSVDDQIEESLEGDIDARAEEFYLTATRHLLHERKHTFFFAISLDSFQTMLPVIFPMSQNMPNYWHK